LPAVTVREDGEAEIEKSAEPAAFTINVMVVEWVRLGLVLVPVIVSV
jgi:hypothetical protein